jgi:cytochrome c biogenesis protein CcmG/thiol:disulfide interchange protein DsbE
MKRTIPLAVFLILAAFLAAGLRLDPQHVPSPLIGSPAPQFLLAQLHDPRETFTPRTLVGKVWLLNVWASWCVTCRVEHPVLMELARSAAVPVYGLAYKDARENALAFLQTFGNPYVLSVQDPDGRVGIDYGVYGVPETYLIDRTGVIRFKQVGPVTPDVVDQDLLPMVARFSR